MEFVCGGGIRSRRVTLERAIAILDFLGLFVFWQVF